MLPGSRLRELRRVDGAGPERLCRALLVLCQPVVDPRLGAAFPATAVQNRTSGRWDVEFTLSPTPRHV